MSAGWITRRFHSTGRAKWGRPVAEAKRHAPLRRIAQVLRPRASMFDSDWVELECGHQVAAYGNLRARCTKCGAG
jgi:hypothetical protein